MYTIGAIGLNAIYGCKVAGAKNIIGIDINESKKEVAQAFGATEFINATTLDEPVNEYLAKKYQDGVDYAFDCIGSKVFYVITLMRKNIRLADIRGIKFFSSASTTRLSLTVLSSHSPSMERWLWLAYLQRTLNCS